MPSFSEKSLARLSTCDSRLQRLFQQIVQDFDCSIIEGHRDEARQHFFADREQVRDLFKGAAKGTP